MNKKLFALACVALSSTFVWTSTIGSQTRRELLPFAAERGQQPIAETQLLMQGLTQANFRGLERIFKEKPTERNQWVFARGQALLIAEAANLLLIRPPSEGQAVWNERALDMRRAAQNLVKTIADCDYQSSRNALFRLANSCNRCHQSFRVTTEITPFAKKQRGIQ